MDRHLTAGARIVLLGPDLLLLRRYHRSLGLPCVWSRRPDLSYEASAACGCTDHARSPQDHATAARAPGSATLYDQLATRGRGVDPPSPPRGRRMQRHIAQSALARYGVAVASVALAVVPALWLLPLALAGAQFLLVAVLVTGWVSGLRPALVALGPGHAGLQVLFHAAARVIECRRRPSPSSDRLRGRCGAHGDGERRAPQGGGCAEGRPRWPGGAGSRANRTLPGPGQLGRGHRVGSGRHDLSVLVRERPGRAHPRLSGGALALRADFLEGSPAPGRSRVGGAVLRTGHRREPRPRFRIPDDRGGRARRVAA